jgi:hypothetical protein
MTLMSGDDCHLFVKKCTGITVRRQEGCFLNEHLAEVTPNNNCEVGELNLPLARMRFEESA